MSKMIKATGRKEGREFKRKTHVGLLSNQWAVLFFSRERRSPPTTHPPSLSCACPYLKLELVHGAHHDAMVGVPIILLLVRRPPEIKAGVRPLDHALDVGQLGQVRHMEVVDQHCGSLRVLRHHPVTAGGREEECSLVQDFQDERIIRLCGVFGVF